MILTAQQIKSIARGVLRVEVADGYVSLRRMNAEQEKYYEENTQFGFKARATSGVRLAFRTTSK